MMEQAYCIAARSTIMIRCVCECSGMGLHVDENDGKVLNDVNVKQRSVYG